MEGLLGEQEVSPFQNAQGPGMACAGAPRRQMAPFSFGCLGPLHVRDRFGFIASAQPMLCVRLPSRGLDTARSLDKEAVRLKPFALLPHRVVVADDSLRYLAMRADGINPHHPCHLSTATERNPRSRHEAEENI
jgi:hypothetical protein